MIDLRADTRQGRAGAILRLKGQTHTYHLQRVGEKYGGYTGQGAAEQPPQWGLLRRSSDDNGAELLVGNEFDGSIWEDTQEGSRVATEKPTNTVLFINIAHSCYNAEPGASIFRELGVGRLEKDFDAIEGADQSFGLRDSGDCQLPFIQNMGK